MLGEFHIGDGITCSLDEDGRSFFEAFRTYSPVALNAAWSEAHPWLECAPEYSDARRH